MEWLIFGTIVLFYGCGFTLVAIAYCEEPQPQQNRIFVRGQEYADPVWDNLPIPDIKRRKAPILIDFDWKKEGF